MGTVELRAEDEYSRVVEVKVPGREPISCADGAAVTAKKI